MLELPSGGASRELVGELVAGAEDGGVCGEPIGGLVRVAEEDDASVVPSGLSGSLVTVTQSVSDTVLLFAKANGTPGMVVVV